MPSRGGGRSEAEDNEDDGGEKAVAREGEGGMGGTGPEGEETTVVDVEWYADDRGCRAGCVRC